MDRPAQAQDQSKKTCTHRAIDEMQRPQFPKRAKRKTNQTVQADGDAKQKPGKPYLQRNGKMVKKQYILHTRRYKVQVEAYLLRMSP